MALVWDDAAPAQAASGRLVWDDEPPQRPPVRTSPGFAFARSAIDELTSALPIRRLPELLQARRALAGDEEARQAIMSREQMRMAAEREHPIATGAGRVAGFAPAFLMAEGPVKAATAGIPAIAKLASGGRIARATLEGIRQVGQVGLAEAIQGRPEAIVPSASIMALLGPVSTIPRALLRIPAGAAVMGGLSAAFAQPEDRLQAGAFGGGLGALASLVPSSMRPRATRYRMPPVRGMPPESYLLDPRSAFPEEFTTEAAARAAKEGAEEIVRRQPPSTLATYRARYGPEAFPETPAPRKIPVRYHSQQEGFKELPAIYQVDLLAPDAQGRPIGSTVEFNPVEHEIVGAKEGVTIPTQLLRSRKGFVALPEEAGVQRGAQAVIKSAISVGIGEAAQPTQRAEQSGRVQRILSVIQEAKPIRGQQEALYTEARAQRMARVLAVREGGPGGEAGFHRELGQLKGALPRVQYESLRGKIPQADIDELFNDIHKSRLNFWETLPAKGGLQKMLEGSVPTEGELRLLRQVFGPELVKTLAAKRLALNRFAQFGLDVLGSMRAFAAGVGDMSLALRQAIVVAPRFPRLWTRAFTQMHRQYFSPKFFKASQQEIASRPTFAQMQEHGLHLTGIAEGMREEPFQSTILQRIPGVRVLANAAERAYTGMGNRLRADLFDRYVALNKRLGGEVYDLDQMANVINTWTGRGALRLYGTRGIESAPSLARMAPVLNATLFSPRLLASRLNLLDPMYYRSLSKPARQEAIKTFTAFVATGASMLGLAKAAGVEVGTDPRSADFGKLKIGNTRIDIWGGFQQPVVLFLRLLSGQMVSSTTGREFTLGEGGYKPTTRLDILQRFAGSKVSPPVRLALALFQGTTATGQKTNLSAEVVNSFVPMFLGDLYELIQEHGLDGAWGGPLSFYGAGVQTYGRQIPTIGKTPAGRATVQFRQPPELGEAALNALTGKRISNIPPQYHRPLSRLRLQEQRDTADIDKAKALTAQDGKRRVQAGVLITLEDGIVKTKTLQKRLTPLKAVTDLQQAGRLVWD